MFSAEEKEQYLNPPDLLPVKNFLSNALELRYARQDSSQYTLIVKQLRERDDPDTAWKVLVALTSFSAQLTKNLHIFKQLFDAVFTYNWNGSTAVTLATLDLISQIVSTNATFLAPALQLFVQHFLPPINSKGSTSLAENEIKEKKRLQYIETNKYIHRCIKYILSIVPAGRSVLLATLLQHYPHKRFESSVQRGYVQQLLRVCEYAPLLQERLLELVLERCLEMDVEIVIEDSGEVRVEATDEDEDDYEATASAATLKGILVHGSVDDVQFAMDDHSAATTTVSAGTKSSGPPRLIVSSSAGSSGRASGLKPSIDPAPAAHAGTATATKTPRKDSVTSVSSTGATGAAGVGVGAAPTDELPPGSSAKSTTGGTGAAAGSVDRVLGAVAHGAVEHTQTRIPAEVAETADKLDAVLSMLVEFLGAQLQRQPIQSHPDAAAAAAAAAVAVTEETKEADNHTSHSVGSYKEALLGGMDGAGTATNNNHTHPNSSGYSRSAGAGTTTVQRLFEQLISIFERKILATHKSKFVQFCLFYVAYHSTVFSHLFCSRLLALSLQTAPYRQGSSGARNSSGSSSRGNSTGNSPSQISIRSAGTAGSARAVAALRGRGNGGSGKSMVNSSSVIVRQSAIMYLASYLARAEFVPIAYVREIVCELLSWAREYAQTYGPQVHNLQQQAHKQQLQGLGCGARAGAGPGAGAGDEEVEYDEFGRVSFAHGSRQHAAQRHEAFYGVVQCICYVLCFHGVQLALLIKDGSGSSDSSDSTAADRSYSEAMKQSKTKSKRRVSDGNDDSATAASAINYLRSQLSYRAQMQEQWDQVLCCGLDPLRFCLRSIRIEFLTLALHVQLLSPHCVSHLSRDTFYADCVSMCGGSTGSATMTLLPPHQQQQQLYKHQLQQDQQDGCRTAGPSTDLSDMTAATITSRALSPEVDSPSPSPAAAPGAGAVVVVSSSSTSAALYSSDLTPANILDSFFPFDPCLLCSLHQSIEAGYRSWEGVPGLEEDPLARLDPSATAADVIAASNASNAACNAAEEAAVGDGAMGMASAQFSYRLSGYVPSTSIPIPGGGRGTSGVPGALGAPGVGGVTMGMGGMSPASSLAYTDQGAAMSIGSSCNAQSYSNTFMYGGSGVPTGGGHTPMHRSHLPSGSGDDGDDDNDDNDNEADADGVQGNDYSVSDGGIGIGYGIDDDLDMDDGLVEHEEYEAPADPATHPSLLYHNSAYNYRGVAHLNRATNNGIANAQPFTNGSGSLMGSASCINLGSAAGSAGAGAGAVGGMGVIEPPLPLQHMNEEESLAHLHYQQQHGEGLYSTLTEERLRAANAAHEAARHRRPRFHSFGSTGSW